LAFGFQPSFFGRVTLHPQSGNFRGERRELPVDGLQRLAADPGIRLIR
jgi:hypothetical protein